MSIRHLTKQVSKSMSKEAVEKQHNDAKLERDLHGVLKNIEEAQSEINKQVQGYEGHFTNLATNLLIALAQHPAIDPTQNAEALAKRAIEITEAHRLQLEQYAAKLQNEAVVDPRLLQHREQLMQTMEKIGAALGHPKDVVNKAQLTLAEKAHPDTNEAIAATQDESV